jgi:hypothetical protein
MCNNNLYYLVFKQHWFIRRRFGVSSTSAKLLTLITSLGSCNLWVLIRGDHCVGDWTSACDLCALWVNMHLIPKTEDIALSSTLPRKNWLSTVLNCFCDKFLTIYNVNQVKYNMKKRKLESVFIWYAIN